MIGFFGDGKSCTGKVIFGGGCIVNAEVWVLVVLVCYVFQEGSLLSVTLLQERGNK